jgi:hypothetical protein
MSKVIRIATREANLKQRLRRHLRKLGLRKSEDGGFKTLGSGKDVVRALHAAQRTERLKANKDFVNDRMPDLLKYFASGSDVVPELINPILRRVRAESWESDLFRLASLTWAVPVSNGFGRRMRYLVFDQYNDKLIGLIAIGDPVFNLAVRDRLIGWNSQDRAARLVNIMDAYVLGAVPPYSMLLGGKLVATLVRSRELYDDFTEAYGASTGVISGEEKKARLLAVTTSSSLGRSSVYNRLKLGKTEYFSAIGYTGGWGHFHIPDALFTDLRAYLRAIRHPYADLHRFGEGPNWRLRTTRAALDALGFKDDMLRHGIQREVFLCTMAENALSILKKGKGHPETSTLLTVAEIASLARERWLVPRAVRRPEFRAWNADQIVDLVREQRRGKKAGEMR